MLRYVLLPFLRWCLDFALGSSVFVRLRVLVLAVLVAVDRMRGE